MDRPLIGLACTYEEHEERLKMSVNAAYVELVALGGGVPVVLVPTYDKALKLDKEALTELVRRCDGLILPGGWDVHPQAYGQDPHPMVKDLWPDLDEFQFACFEAARDRMPILGICRGLQLINVALGGTLIQHLPDYQRAQGTTPLEHCQNSHPWIVHHQVETAAGSDLAALLGDKFMVNTFHHQAIDRPAASLRVTAYAADGIIEGVEGDNTLWGVQWHPEGMLYGGHNRTHLPLITEFIARCQK